MSSSQKVGIEPTVGMNEAKICLKRVKKMCKMK